MYSPEWTRRPTCSLRDVLTKSGPRTCVFSVTGTITVSSAIWSVPGDLTIAGQTAPGGGIQIKGDGSFGGNGTMLWLNGNNVIVRYLRIRPGNAPLNASFQGLIGMTIDGSSDIVIDHNSFEWDSSKAVSWWSADGLNRGTFSWNIDAESLAPHSTGPIVGGYNMGQANLDVSSWDGHHNILASLDHRLPQTSVKYGRWINNLAFGYYYATLVRGGTQFDLIGNVYDGGLTSGILPYTNRREVRWADTLTHNEGVLLPGGKAQIHMANNFGPSNPLGAFDDFTTMFRIASSENSQLGDDPVDTQFRAASSTTPATLNHWPITISPLGAPSELKDLLIPTAGAYRRLACDGSWATSRFHPSARPPSYPSPAPIRTWRLEQPARTRTGMACRTSGRTRTASTRTIRPTATPSGRTPRGTRIWSCTFRGCSRTGRRCREEMEGLRTITPVHIPSGRRPAWPPYDRSEAKGGIGPHASMRGRSQRTGGPSQAARHC